MKINSWIKDNQNTALKWAFIVVGLLTIPAYIYARSKMTLMIVYLYIIESPLTLNFLLFLFFAGLFTDRYIKQKQLSKRKGWLLFAAQFVAVVLFFRLIGGGKTIFG